MPFACLWRQVIPGILALLFLFSPVPGAANGFMPVDEIKPGMHGIAKTVVSGSKIEEFGVEVLGILKDKSPTGDLILIRVYGDLIEKTGIAQGMSGSPVYIDGRLIGAISYGWALTDHKTGMVTPIADMLKIWKLPGSEPNRSAVTTSDDGQDEAQPLATPIMAAGFSHNALQMLKEKLAPFRLVPYGVGSQTGDTEVQPLQPGSIVGVELVRGDVSLGALGTVTYTEDDKVLAFGHPFLKKGKANMFLTNAQVITVINGLENAFKVGITGEAVGMVNQDRSAGIGGVVGRYPDIIPMRIIARDNSTGNSRDAAVQVIQDEQLSPLLAATTVFNVIDKTLDRTGPGTAHVYFEIAGQQMPVDTIARENMFYSAANIGEQSVAELFEIITALLHNQYNSVDIMDVKVHVILDSERKTAAVMEARANKKEVRPGDSVDIAVKLKPFRGEKTITRTVTFKVPKNQPDGPLTLEVRGGGFVPLIYALLGNQGMDNEGKKPKKQRTFADLVESFTSRDRNNDIVAEVLDMNYDDLNGNGPAPQPRKGKPKAVSQEEQLPKFVKPGGKTPGVKDSANKTKFHVTTDYIIEGDTQVMLQVVSDAKGR